MSLLDSKKYVNSNWNGVLETWKNVEFFREHWEKRVECMAQLISQNSLSIMDYGCGEGKLKKYINHEITYYAVDYKLRDGLNNLVCDFNKREFPDIKVDTGFLSGCLEYIIDYQWFISEVCKHCKKEIVISFCVLELFRDVNQRKSIGQNCLISILDLVNLFYINGYILTDSLFWNQTPVFKFIKRKGTYTDGESSFSYTNKIEQ